MSDETALTALIGIEVPIFSAPMGGISGGALASAVSRSGALGMIGMGSAGSVPLLERELALLDTGGAPFGIGLVDWVVRQDEMLLERALEARPAVLAVSFAEWNTHAPTHDWVSRAHRIGTLAATQVSSPKEAELAATARVDLIVLRGSEAGGHGDPHRPLAGFFEDTVTKGDRLLLVAGALASHADLEPFLERGAAGGWVGTAFSACPESLATNAARAALLEARGSDTIVTHVLDAALGHPWPKRFPERLIATDFIRRWHGREHELIENEVALREFQWAVAADDYSIVPLDAGLGIDNLTDILPAAQVLDSFRAAHR